MTQETQDGYLRSRLTELMIEHTKREGVDGRCALRDVLAEAQTIAACYKWDWEELKRDAERR